MPGVLLAYKFVATAVMLLEINYCASQLHLPLNLPVRENEIKNLNLLNPTYVGFLGSIDAKNYTFSFIKSGRLCYIIKRDHPYYKFEGGTTKSRAYFEGLTQKKSLMDTEKAYSMAANWLRAIDVDVDKLEREHPPLKSQMMWMEHSPIPIFEVKWGVGLKALSNGRNYPDVKISILIDGVTGELIHLRQEDASYSKRPFALIKEMDKLLAISDDQFLKLSALERNDLITRFGAVDYSAPVPGTPKSPAH